MKLSHEIVEKIKDAGSPDEILAIAKECNVDMAPEEANKYFAQVNSHELDEDLLVNVSGGWLVLDTSSKTKEESTPKGQC